MAREVTHTATGPRKVDREEFEEMGDIAICQCGLSPEYPFCDGSHRRTEDEAEGVVYKYENDDPEGPRREVLDLVLAEEDTEG